MSDEPAPGGELDDEGWREADELPQPQPASGKPPDGTAIRIERFPDGVTIEIPAAGLWKGSKGLFAMAVLWNGFMAVFTPCMVGSLLGVKQANNAAEALWVLPLVLSLFWVVGIVLLLISINMGRRRAALAVTGGSLMVLKTGLFGTKQRTWAPGEVEAVRVGPSGLTVNDVPVMELQIFGAGSGKFSLLAGRSDDELNRIAKSLRRALRARN